INSRGRVTACSSFGRTRSFANSLVRQSYSSTETNPERQLESILKMAYRFVWLVDPAHQAVTVYRSFTETRQFTSIDSITAEPTFDGSVYFTRMRATKAIQRRTHPISNKGIATTT